MDRRACENLVIAVVKQAAADYKIAAKHGDNLTCRLIDKQIKNNPLVNAAGLVDTWEYSLRQIRKG